MSTRVEQVPIHPGDSRGEKTPLNFLSANSSAIAFYQRLGGRAVEQVSVMRLDGEGLAALATRSSA